MHPLSSVPLMSHRTTVSALFLALLNVASLLYGVQSSNNSTCAWTASSHQCAPTNAASLGSSTSSVSRTLGTWIRGQELVLLKDKDAFIFDYVVDALSHVFQELAIEHTVSDAFVPGSNATYIIFFTHEPQRRMPTRYIAYNFEQLTTTKPWPAEIFKKFREAVAVFDYSLENIKILNARGVHNTYHVPLGYTPTMESSLPSSTPKDVDVMFVGSLNRRRKMKLRRLVQPNNGNLTVAVKMCFGEDLLRLYQRSRLALNLHYFSGRTILEVHRILPLLANKVLVLSEPSNDPWWDNEFANLVNFTTAADLRQPVSQLLHTIDISATAQQRYEQLQACCSYQRYVLEAFDRFMHF